MARLDRLGSAAKEVAQAGAAIGREFRFGLLASVIDFPGPQLREALDRLTSAGLLFVRGSLPDTTYLFKHALVQDAAFGSLLRSRRQDLHHRIVAALEERFPEVVVAQPALLAQHCLEAGLAEQAVAYSLKAGQQALALSAMGEAVAQLRKGLEVLAGLPDNVCHQQQELDLQATLGAALSATKGFSAAEVAETFARARALAKQLDRPEYLVPLIAGQWVYHSVRAEYRLSLPLAEQLEQIGAVRNDAAVQSLGYAWQGADHLFLGEFTTARALSERGLAGPAHRVVRGLALDPYAVGLTWLAVTLACLGYIDQARSRMDEALSEARRHAHTLAHALCCATFVDSLTSLPMVHTEELLTLLTEHRFPFYLGLGLAFRGRYLTTCGQVQEGLALLAQGLAELRAIGAVTTTSLLFAWLAKAYAELNQPDEERRCLAEAARVVETNEERVFKAELLRVRGDLLNAAGDQFGAEQRYRQAIAVAERQSARLFQLRDSTSLARFWRDQGKRAEARDLLGPIYHWFTEGFDAPDLKDAKALLDELR
jgi:tetratricopeptide (TPR) repeat protein